MVRGFPCRQFGELLLADTSSIYEPADAKCQESHDNKQSTDAESRHIRRRHLRYNLAEKDEVAKEMRMDLKDWKVTINQIADEIKQEPPKSRKHKVLLAWRVKLEKEPTSLQPSQIDEIVREVQKRISR